MISSNEKISTRQAVILFIMTTYSPAIRLLPQLTAQMAGKAGWLTPIAAFFPMALLIYIIHYFFKKYRDANLSDVYIKILGKFLGNIIIFIYHIWILILMALYVRYFAERLLSSILPHTSIAFLIISMLIMVFIAVRSGLVPLVRANEIFFGIFLVVFLIVFLFAIPEITFRNYMYVSYLDAVPVAKASHVVFALWGYFLFFFFFGDKINDKEHIKRFAFQGLFAVCFLTVLLLIMTIGALGPVLATHVSLPYFIVVKNISILGTIERMESIILALWVVSDFIIITVFASISVSLNKSIFKLSGTKTMISPTILFAGIGALYLSKDRFELEAFSTYIALPANTIFEFIIPVIVFGIGKLRKKI